jgi:hypothetical protein
MFGDSETTEASTQYLAITTLCTYVSKAMVKMSATSFAFCRNTGVPRISYAANRPPMTRIVISNTLMSPCQHGNHTCVKTRQHRVHQCVVGFAGAGVMVMLVRQFGGACIECPAHTPATAAE